MSERPTPLIAGVRRMTVDATSLVVASGLNILLGLVFWLAATWMYPADVVGRATTSLNSAILLATLSNLAFGPMYERFLPVAGRFARRLIGSGQAIAAVLAAAFAGLFLLLAPTEELFLDPAGAALLLVATPVLALFSLHDGILVGLHRGRWAAIKNTAHAVVKLLLVVALASAGSSLAIMLSWIAPAAVAVVVVNVVLFWVRRGAPESAVSHLPSVRTLVGFGASSLAWVIALTVPGLVVPVLVLSDLGPADAAYFNIAWMIVAASNVLIGLVSGPYVGEASRVDADLPRLTRAHIKLMVIASAGRALAVGVLGPIALFIYGAEYAAAATPLIVIMALVQFLACGPSIYGNLARVYGRILYPTVVQALGAIVVVVLSALWLGRFGIVAVGWAWLVHEVLVVIAATPPLVILLRRALRGER